MKVKILVAYHRDCWLPPDSVYLPSCTGRASAEEADAGASGPALPTGGVPCGGHPALCEIQALQWARTHIGTGEAAGASHIGLCHYRRYFARHAPAAPLETASAWLAKATSALAPQPLRACPEGGRREGGPSPQASRVSPESASRRMLVFG